jgi:hypothetical protein
MTKSQTSLIKKRMVTKMDDALLTDGEVAIGEAELSLNGLLEFTDDSERVHLTNKGWSRAFELLKQHCVNERMLLVEFIITLWCESEVG